MSRNTSPTPNHSGRWVISEFGGPSVLRWEKFEIPSEIPKHHVLVRIIVAGIAGPDNIQRVGGYPNVRCSKPGFTPGYDFVGEVVAQGVMSEEVFEIGDRVTCMCMIGAHATHIILPASELIRIQPTDDPLQVCALPLNYMTAWGMLKRSGVDLHSGSSILIGSASGGIGTAIAQLVHAFDLRLKMIGTCSASKFDYVSSLGIIPIDRRDPSLVDKVHALTEGRGVDVAYDAVGSEDSLRKSHQATKRDVGHLVAIGVMSEIASDGSGLKQPSFDAAAVLASRSQPRMKYWGVEREYYQETRDLWLADFNAILQKVREGKLKPQIAKLFPLSEAVEANKYLISGVDVKGKMLFVVDEQIASFYKGF
ncbi:hypothetical protein PISL3812_07860 [Talaromyces islandicus]|uniref:Enoyl reductase (ER) domain-containing protein n=1 Tax=Talaromyces islandicus TaxID=28573 RepID=A0A0U1M5H2_TALIS|nr:hypothetical protein PISL3812_07860 [Talaromyces islandicus]